MTTDLKVVITQRVFANNKVTESCQRSICKIVVLQGKGTERELPFTDIEGHSHHVCLLSVVHTRNIIEKYMWSTDFSKFNFQFF